MDMSSEWLSELEMEDPGFVNQYDQMSTLYDKVDNFCVDSFFSESGTKSTCFINQSVQTPPISIEEPPKIKLPSYQKITGTITKSSPTPNPIISTNFPSYNTLMMSFGDLKPKYGILQLKDSLGYVTADTRKVSTKPRNPIHVQDHVLAERKRREKLNQHFISLSALLPNLRKMDKASVLENAINYIKEFQGRVKELEALSGIKRKDVQESIVSVKRSRRSGSDDEYSSSDEINSEEGNASCKSSPEIEVRMCGSSVLVRIQCLKSSFSFVNALSEMQKLGLLVISSSSMPFANTILTTIVAQIADNFIMTATDIWKNLQLVI